MAHHASSPTLSFTIPSIHDDTVLQCRVYHPSCLAPTSISQITAWNKKAAIVAHPYAVLGGCYDDPIVDIISATILKQGFMVGTFNFRGAGTSKGRTSYQSKPEQSDYLSFVGFMIYYMHHLSPPPVPIDLPIKTCSSGLHDLSPVPSQALPPPHDPRYTSEIVSSPTTVTPAIAVQGEKEGVPNTQPRLLLAGYSYGALITTHLPPIISSVVSQFQSPAEGSACAEIRLRAESLAEQQNEAMQTTFSSLLNKHSHKRGRSLHAHDALQSPTQKASGVRMGGEEDLRRGSHDSYRSRSSFSREAPEKLRRSVDRVRSIGRTKRLPPKRTNTDGSTASSKSKGNESQSSLENIPPHDGSPDVEKSAVCKAVPDLGVGLQTAYLLVSPLQGLVGHLVTLWSTRSWKDSIPEHEMKLAVDPTLAIFGDDDVFVSVKRLRSWADRLSEASNGKGSFRSAEVAGAGHFWQDYEAIKVLQDEVRAFVQTL